MRTTISIIAGIIAGGLVVAAIEATGHLIFPPPPGTDITDPEQLAAIMDQIPFLAKLMVIIAWAVGALAGGFAATKLSRLTVPMPAFWVGGVLLLLGVLTMLQFSHPWWMWILGVALPVPMAYWGFTLAAGREAAG